MNRIIALALIQGCSYVSGRFFMAGDYDWALFCLAASCTGFYTMLVED